MALPNNNADTIAAWIENLIARVEAIEAVVAPLCGQLGAEITAGTQAAGLAVEGAQGVADAVEQVVQKPAPQPAPVIVPASPNAAVIAAMAARVNANAKTA